MELNNLPKDSSNFDQLIQSEKMASFGQLSAGIAHEINNPINFVYTSLNLLRKKLNNLFLLLDKYAEYDSNENVDIKKFSRQINLFKRDINFKKTLRNINELFDAIYEGTERTMKIVRDMQQFSRAGDKEIGTVNINKNIDSTLTLLYNQYKEYIEITKEYCDDSEIDNGMSIEKGKLSKIWEPFFTTKGEKRAGIGLNISKRIIEGHRGKISCSSQPGRETIFSFSILQ